VSTPAPGSVPTAVEGDAGYYRVRGPVTMDNVEAVLQQGSARFGAGEVIVDLAGVTEVDSSAVSLLLQWVREAQAGGRSVRYVNLNPSIRSLAVLYGVIDLLPVQDVAVHPR
jgi:phospholipid transport system transporter-binding protein